jgi:histidinol-phosphate aminotransferase
MSLHPRPEIEGIETCSHGGPDYAELKRLGFEPSEVLDFSVSSNPFGPPPRIKEALSSAAIDRYPDSESMELKSALSESIGVSAENIIVGNGSMELIRLITLAYFGRNDAVLIIEPTFGEYEVACRISGSGIIKHHTRVEEGFKLNLDEVRDLIRQYCPKGIFLCNPNNPTGQHFGRIEVEEIITACEHTLLILDEAYIAFAENPWYSLDLIHRGNTIILRSMTKDYALAGLRLGYAVASTEIIEILRKVRPPWNVNTVAQRAGVISLSDPSYLPRCYKGVHEMREFLKSELAQLGLHPLPSQVHFFLVKVGDARKFRQDLLRYGILVRDCSSFGLPEYIRISPRTKPECQRLIGTIREIRNLRGGKI